MHSQEDRLTHVFCEARGSSEDRALELEFRNVYKFGHTFRAENSNTERKDAELWMVENEIAFDDLEDDMELDEEMLK